jgi:hemerythrin
MPAFEWRDFFSIGHEEIDNQHKQLFAIVNALYDGLRRGDAPDDLLKISLDQLCAYTRSHFADEERLMLAAGYPEFARHKAAHDMLAGRLAEFEARVRAGETRVAAELLPFLVGDWLSRHIAFEDQQYAGYLNSQRQRERAWRKREDLRLPETT